MHRVDVTTVWLNLVYRLPFHCVSLAARCAGRGTVVGRDENCHFLNKLATLKTCRVPKTFEIHTNTWRRTVALHKETSNLNSLNPFRSSSHLSPLNLERRSSWVHRALSTRFLISITPRAIHLFHGDHNRIEATCWKACSAWGVLTTLYEKVRAQESVLRSLPARSFSCPTPCFSNWDRKAHTDRSTVHWMQQLFGGWKH